MKKITTDIPVVRSALAGFLMGMANLVPGISGGTMILVMGLYDDFIRHVADVTRMKFSRTNIVFLVIIATGAVAAIAIFAGVMSRAVTLYPSAMFSLFIGLTLGGVPLLIKMLKGFNTSAILGLIVGFTLITGIAMTSQEPPDKAAIREAIAQGTFIIQPQYSTDFAAGMLGMSAMILPGISGAYMLLILQRYETILASVAMMKDYVISAGQEGDPTMFLKVIVPTAIGAIISLVLLSNFLKWMLKKHEKLMLGFLLGILLGSVIGIWPFDQTATVQDMLWGSGLAIAGFFSTVLLSRISA